jgi:hypothetical protein
MGVGQIFRRFFWAKMFESFDEEDLSMIEGETEMVVNKEVRKCPSSDLKKSL